MLLSGQQLYSCSTKNDVITTTIEKSVSLIFYGLFNNVMISYNQLAAQLLKFLALCGNQCFIAVFIRAFY
jgi:hypothetical protein